MARSPHVRKSIVCTFAILVVLLPIRGPLAQNGRGADASVNILRDWLALDAPPGWEHLATDHIMRAMTGWRRDALGNLILRQGSGSPRRVVACGLDRPGFAVTEITDAGYLRLREVGSLRQRPLWAQFHEGQRINVLTRSGAVPGVVAVKGTHLQRGRAANAAVATLDDLWIDVGATSRAEVAALGIALLAAVKETAGGLSEGRAGEGLARWLALPEITRSRPVKPDAFVSAAELLKTLTDIPSVSGHERPVREAHLDEVGFEVTNIAADGTVSLRNRGGLFPSLWEGQPALLHLDDAKSPLGGVFVARETAATKQLQALTASFGHDAAALKQLGVVIFAWSVREETDLEALERLVHALSTTP